MTPIDTRLGALGGTTFRRVRGEAIDAELIRETESTRTELEHLSTELRESSSEATANVAGAIDAQRRKLEALVGRVDETLAQQKAEFESRLATLREQRGKARENQRKRIDARMDELKASYEARKSKLDEARQHAKASIDAARRALVP